MLDDIHEPNLTDVMAQLGLETASPAVQQRMFSEIQNLAQKRVLDAAWDSLPQNIIQKITESSSFEEQHVGFAIQFVPESANRIRGEIQAVVAEIKRKTAAAAKESSRRVKETVTPLKEEADQILSAIQQRTETAAIDNLKDTLE